ncbi:DUF3240 domain-containing protein [Rhodoblastus acidophilus]|jgi:hypothetical protein|uniref:DUF3240 domain-containing protein n=1 Tax=Rhodoblastus acidophilus TaxID=1074 RepID=A0A6N8DJ12_RHOAC|nr:DUF3240 family protein [Rhodoblastus acidophilus]MCW2273638.1 hypothetical protein [Rhodoblastus acidophilus]MTV30278.1 DUF3240 domain-containing protein [Rhodoblastus acidophilus]
MDRDLCKLTLVYPVATEDRIIDFLLDEEPPLPGFVSWRAEGHGGSFEGCSAREKVRGRIERGMLVMVLGRARLETLLADLRNKCAIPHLAYWIEPVERFGTYA